jgi:uncharacterized protein YggE
MRYVKFVIAAVLAGFFLIGLPQYSLAADKDTITVTGTAITEAEPDMATVRLDLQKNGSTAEAARNDLAEQLQSLRNVLLGQVIPDKDISISGYALNPNYEYEKGKQVQKGFIASATAVVKVRDLHQLSSVIDKSISRSGASVEGVEFGLQHKNMIERDLLDDAVTNGKAKAIIVARAGGRVLGTLVSADINNSGGETRVMMDNAALSMVRMAKYEAAAAPTVLAPGTITVQTTVHMVFALQ